MTGYPLDNHDAHARPVGPGEFEPDLAWPGHLDGISG